VVAKLETDTTNRTLLALQMRWPKGLFYRRNVGAAILPSGRFVRFGYAGMADIAGVVDSISVEVETKTGDERQRKEQRGWQAAVERAGGVYVLARTPEEAVEQVERELCKRDRPRL
jgi:predicted TIM-barrel fold metal-dependent hydrolase